MGFQKCFRQSFGFLAEEQVASVFEICLGVAPGRFRGQTPHLPYFVTGEKVIQIFVISDLDQVPVIQSGASDSFLRNVKAQGSDQVQMAAGGSAGTGNIAAILRNLRFDQNDVQHRNSPRMGEQGFLALAVILYAKVSLKST